MTNEPAYSARSLRLSSTLTSGNERAGACGYEHLFSVLMIAPLSFDFDPILRALDHVFLAQRIVWRGLHGCQIIFPLLHAERHGGSYHHTSERRSDGSLRSKRYEVTS